MPDHGLLGTYIGQSYEWMTFKEVERAARNFAAGCWKLGLNPVTQAEGKPWRFLGIQSKNRKEWNICHIANMYTSTTTIALYDTLGQEAIKFVTDQTELTTYCCSNDFVDKLTQLKLTDMDEKHPRMQRLVNLVSWEKVLD